MVRIIIAVIAAPVVWGLVGVPTNQLLLSFFPDAEAGNFSTTVLVISLVASFVFSLIAGAVAALIAARQAPRIGLYAGLAVLVVGLGAQLASWAMFPLWYHLLFLAALVPFCMLGAAPIIKRAAA